MLQMLSYMICDGQKIYFSHFLQFFDHFYHISLEIFSNHAKFSHPTFLGHQRLRSAW